MTFPSSLRIRPARASDHAAFVRLFPELAVDDPVRDAEKFTRELVPSTLIAEEAEAAEAPGAPGDAGAPGNAEAAAGYGPARALGYAYFQIIEDLAYVRHLVTAPEARKRGVGRALMNAVAERARAAGCSSWCLNVKPDNTAALALYRGVGLSPAHASKALKVAWSIVDATPADVHSARISAHLVEAPDDARFEKALGLLSGQLGTSRALGGRVIMGLLEDQAPVGITVFDPTFPGAYPFRVARPEVAFVLLRAIRPHARAADQQVALVSEGQPDVADALLAAGATLNVEILHMSGPLPVAGA